METMDNIHELQGCRTVNCVRMAVPGSDICTRCYVQSQTEELEQAPLKAKVLDFPSKKKGKCGIVIK